MERRKRSLRALRSVVTLNLRAPRESCLLEPWNDTTNLRCKTLQSPNLLNAELLENTCLDRTDHEKVGSNATASEEEAHVCWKRRPLIANRNVAPSFLELHAVKNSDRHHQASQKFLQHTLSADIPLVADAEVDEALVSYFNEKYRLRNSWRHSAWSDVPLLPGVRETRRTLLATQPSYPAGLEASHPPRSRNPHVWCIWSLLRMVTRYFTPRSPLTILRRGIQVPVQGISYRHQALLYPKYRPPKSKTCEANDTLELYCPWCTRLPMTATTASEAPRNVHSTSTVTNCWWRGKQ